MELPVCRLPSRAGWISKSDGRFAHVLAMPGGQAKPQYLVGFDLLISTFIHNTEKLRVMSG
jgi:hypothetical protein